MASERGSIASAFGSIRRSIGGDLQGSQERATGSKAPNTCPHNGDMDKGKEMKEKSYGHHERDY